MEQFEKVEKIVEKTGVSFEEAKEALTAAGDDLLDAVIYLEKQGKVKSPKMDHYTTSAEEQNVSKEFEQAQSTYEDSCKQSRFKESMHSFWERVRELFQKSCEYQFRVEKEDKELFSVPVILFLVAAVLAFWLVLILLIVGLFCNCRYSFQGVKPTTIDINGMCDKAAETCENIKKDFQNRE